MSHLYIDYEYKYEYYSELVVHNYLQFASTRFIEHILYLVMLIRRFQKLFVKLLFRE